MSECLILLVGLIVGVGISYFSDQPRLRHYFNEGYDWAVQDMLKDNCYYDKQNNKRFVNVIEVNIADGRDP